MPMMCRYNNMKREESQHLFLPLLFPFALPHPNVPSFSSPSPSASLHGSMAQIEC
jgi:hypothetical protein